MDILKATEKAMQEPVKLLNAIGLPCTYTPKATGIPVVDVPVMIKELGGAELVGDYRQGDLKVELDASKLAEEPLKYDVMVINGKTFTVFTPHWPNRMVGSGTYTYKFVVRGA